MRLTSMLFALALVSCGGGLSGKLCGDPGQPCCEMDACNPGALCGTGQLCSACGADGQQCCAANTCNETLACSNGKCSPALSCGVSCTLGSSRCVSNGIETCTPLGVCPAWRTTITSCPSGATCVVTGSTADCVEACPGACTPGTQVCSVNGLRSCSTAGMCPELTPLIDNTDIPACTTGSIISPEIAWESPAPMGNTVVDIAGDLASSYWVLDDLGNVYHYGTAAWERELAVAPNRKVNHLASCKQGSRLYASSENGAVYRRAGAMWTEEGVGSTTNLIDVACDPNSAYAVGADGRLYYRTGLTAGTWASVPTGATQPLTSITDLPARQELYLAGNAGTIVHCDTSVMPPACAPENSHSTANLKAIWGDEISGVVLAVGEGGTWLQRGAIWQSAGVGSATTDTFTAIDGYYDPVSLTTWQVAVTSAGKVFVRENAFNPEVATISEPFSPALGSVWLPNSNNLLVGGYYGALWFRPGPVDRSPFTARGGRGPVKTSAFAVASVGHGRLFAVGEGGMRMQRLNDTWALDQVGSTTTSSLYGVAARNAGEVYAVGLSGLVLVRRFGTWTVEAENLTNESLMGVVVDTEHVYAIGQSLMLEKDLAMGTWRVLPLPPVVATPGQAAIALRTDPQGRAVEVVTVGNHCSVASYSPSTGLFTNQSCTDAENLTSAAFNASGDLFAVSEGGFLYHRVGSALVQEAFLGLDAPYAVIADGSTMWATSGGGALYRRVGTSWVNTAQGVTERGFFGGVSDDTGLYLVGVGGMVLHRF